MRSDEPVLPSHRSSIDQVRTGTRVEPRETDELASDAILQTFNRDFVLLQQARWVAVCVLLDLVFNRLDDLTCPGCNFAELRKVESNDTGGEETLP